jgi:hypothetical protein
MDLAPLEPIFPQPEAGFLLDEKADQDVWIVFRGCFIGGYPP